MHFVRSGESLTGGIYLNQFFFKKQVRKVVKEQRTTYSFDKKRKNKKLRKTNFILSKRSALEIIEVVAFRLATLLRS